MVSLFTNVPLEPVLKFLECKHAEGKVPLPRGYTIKGFLHLIRVCVLSTVFSFNGKYYRQKFGVSMGNPLAPVLACLFMEMWETELRLQLPCKQPSLFKRYIDDILIQWKHSMQDFHVFLGCLNQIDPHIQLKHEVETVDPEKLNTTSIPFLDLNIFRSPAGLSFSIYRKPTHTDLYTHFYSAHPLSTKKGILIGLFTRAYRLCSSEHLNAEITNISRAFKRLQYPKFVINQALSTAKYRFHNPSNREHVVKKYHLKLPCIPAMMRLRPGLSKIGISTSFSSANTLRCHVTKNGPSSTPSNELPGVYKLQCQQCPDGIGSYFGETGLSLPKRMTDHSNDIKNKVSTSSIWSHMKQYPGHIFDLDNPVMIHCSFDEHRRKLVESSLIAQHKNCNNRPGDIPVCRITAPQVLRSLKIDYKHAALPTPDQNAVPAATHSSLSSTPSQLTLAIPTQPVTTPNPSPFVPPTPPFPPSSPPIMPSTQLNPFPTVASPHSLHPAVNTSPISSLSLHTLPSPSFTPLYLTPSRPTQSLTALNPSTPVPTTSPNPSPLFMPPTQPTSPPSVASLNPSFPHTITPPILAPPPPTLLPTQSTTRPASAVPRRLLVFQSSSSHCSQPPFSTMSPLLLSPNFPSASAPPISAPGTSSMVTRLASSWLPSEYSQSPHVPLTSNTRARRAKRLQERHRTQGATRQHLG